MDKDRFLAEKAVLDRKYVAYKFFNLGLPNCYVKIGAKTNSNNVYTLFIDLSNFPENVPKVFVTKMLYTRNGDRMDSPSSSMHTLTSERGWTRICHYGSNAWTPRVSIYKIFIKCRLWLEMYEEHLRTGNPIDYYLTHQF